MSDTKFTPGPWRTINDDELVYITADAASYGDICDLYSIMAFDHNPRTKHNAQANAALIAAAPEMYEMLREYIDTYESLAFGEGVSFEAAARELLAKARGNA